MPIHLPLSQCLVTQGVTMRKDGLLVAALFSLTLSIPCTWANEPIVQPTIGRSDEPSQMIKEATAAQEPLTTLPNKNGRIEQQVAERKRTGEGLTKEELEAAGLTAVEPKEHPLGWVFGFRAGIAIPTQKVLENPANSTTVGPLVNVEALYALREWIRVGIMFEWHRHDIKLGGPEFGTLNIFSLLPTVELRPTREAMRDRGIKWFIPYASLGTGLNINSFSNAARLGNTPVSFSNTFALRVASGLDFPLTSRWAVNTELAWNRDSGNFKLRGAETDFNASTLNLLIGLRGQF